MRDGRTHQRLCAIALSRATGLRAVETSQLAKLLWLLRQGDEAKAVSVLLKGRFVIIVPEEAG